MKRNFTFSVVCNYSFFSVTMFNKQLKNQNTFIGWISLDLYYELPNKQIEQRKRRVSC